MMGVQLHHGFKFKKSLKDALPIKASTVFLETSMFGNEFNGEDGQFVICGPDAHRSRKWWADCKVVNGDIVEVS